MAVASVAATVATISLSFPPLPDLQVQNVNVVEAAPQAGDTVTLAGDGPEIMVESASGDITLESGTWWGGKSDDETGG